jgi:hypothetical protein
MNTVILFNDLTTEEALSAIESEAKSYDGLYVDMEGKEQRKYVKDKAAVINGLLKRLDRARIDKAKDFKSKVEQEAASIKSRLEDANKPFTLLINDYNEKRAKVLAEKKRIEDEKEAAIQLKKDHEEGLQLNRLWELEAKEREAQREAEKQAQIEREKQIAEEAAKQALIQAEQKRLQDEAMAENERAIREADIEHKKKINNEAMQCFVDGGLSEEGAKTAVTLIAKGLIKHTKISY